MPARQPLSYKTHISRPGPRIDEPGLAADGMMPASGVPPASLVRPAPFLVSGVLECERLHRQSNPYQIRFVLFHSGCSRFPGRNSTGAERSFVLCKIQQQNNNPK